MAIQGAPGRLSPELGNHADGEAVIEDLLQIAITLLGVLLAGRLAVSVGSRLGLPSAFVLIGLGMLLRGGAVVPAVYAQGSPWISAAAFVFLLVRAGVALPTRDAAPSRLRVRRVFSIVAPPLCEWGLVFALARGALTDDPIQAALLATLVSAVSPALMLPHLIARAESVREPRSRAVTASLGTQVVLNAIVAQALILFLLDQSGAEVDAPRAAVFVASWPLAWCLGWLLRASTRRLRDPGPLLLLLGGSGVVYFSARSLGAESVLATIIFSVVATRGSASPGGPLRRALRRGWDFVEIPLFVNLGLAIDPRVLADQGIERVAILGVVVLFGVSLRILAAFLTRESGLSRADRRQLLVAQVPKATIQAVFGLLAGRVLAEVPGQEGWSQVVLTASFLAIVLTAPFGTLILAWARRAEAQAVEVPPSESSTPIGR